MKEKFMIVQNFRTCNNWDSEGVHVEKCWKQIEKPFDTAHEAVQAKEQYSKPEYYVVIKYYE